MNGRLQQKEEEDLENNTHGLFRVLETLPPSSRPHHAHTMTDLYPLPLALSSYLGYSGYRKGSLSLDGAITASLVGYASMANPFLGYGLTLITFYLTGSKATKFKASIKSQLETHSSTPSPIVKDSGRVRDTASGNRSAIQVLCNSATAVVACAAFRVLNRSGSWPDPLSKLTLEAGTQGVVVSNLLLTLVVGGHYAACMGDTLASELGILSKSKPRLVTQPWKTVPKGTNGGVSALGLTVSALGGTLIGLVQSISLALHYHFSPRPAPANIQTYAKLTALLTAAGFTGSLIDSILGATLQRTLYNRQSGKVLVGSLAGADKQEQGKWEKVTGWNLLDNNAVNFVASASTALLTAYFGLKLF